MFLPVVTNGRGWLAHLNQTLTVSQSTNRFETGSLNPDVLRTLRCLQAVDSRTLQKLYERILPSSDPALAEKYEKLQQAAETTFQGTPDFGTGLLCFLFRTRSSDVKAALQLDNDLRSCHSRKCGRQAPASGASGDCKCTALLALELGRLMSEAVLHSTV